MPLIIGFPLVGLQLDQYSLSPPEEENINDLYLDVQAIEEQLVMNIGEMTQLLEERRNLKIEIPQYDGSHILFHSWIPDFQKVTQSLSDEEKRTAIITSIADKEVLAFKHISIRLRVVHFLTTWHPQHLLQVQSFNPNITPNLFQI